MQSVPDHRLQLPKGRSRRPGGVIVLQKGRILLTLAVFLSAALIFSVCADSLAAPTSPIIGDQMASASVMRGLNATGGRRYIGMERPDDLFQQMRMRAMQGSGPIPDMQLTPTATASEELYADAAPQGELNRIVISSNGVDEDNDGRFDPGVTAGDFNLWLLRVDGSFATQITDMGGDETSPAYDPGGRLIAFSSNATGVSEIYTVEVLTGTIRQITSSPGNKYEPTWSPDGNWIVFSGDANGNRDLFIIPSDGSQLPQAITTGPDDEMSPDWASSSGIGTAPILFARKMAGGGTNIFRISPDGSGEQQVTNGGGDPTVNDVDPTWRHNGQMIAFASDRLVDAGDTTNDYNIWTVAPIGEGSVSPTLRSNLDEDDVYDERYPTFNPGLSPSQPVRIFFTSWRPDADGAEPDIWRLEVSDPVPPELVDLPSVDADGRFVPPGSDITIHVPVFDRDSGVAQVFAQFKDPDSAVDDSEGIDHKQFDYITTNLQSGETDVVITREVDCETVGGVELFDDGDPAHGDDTADDGIFSGVWTTPTAPSDYIIDITVIDGAGNTFTYDDIYGFTTLVWQPKSNVLLVDDYCEGQGFIYAASGANNDLPTAFPVESYYTTNPGAGGSANTIRNAPKGTGEPYDLWRIICRGPLQITDLVYYLPTKEVQLSVPDLSGQREVLVANRAVVWASPHSGDVWAAEGSIVDASTQAVLATFLDRGGRLMITGQNIGWALTLDGTTPNSFYTNYLHANYVADDNNGGSGAGIIDDFVTGTAGDPVVAHPFSFWPPKDIELPEDDCPIGWWESSDVLYPQDCAHFTVWPDVIEPASGAVVTHTYDSGATAGIRYESPTGYRVAYYAWGFEQTHKVWGGDPSHSINYRSKWMHNTLCWLRTGGFQGRVLSISDGNQPITNPAPIVRVFRGGQMVAAVECEEDGRYVMGGLPPGVYSLSAYRPGFEIDHSEAQSTHGGLKYPVVDFAISRAEPGAIRGTVTSLATGDPLGAVQVCAYESLPSAPADEEASTAEPAQSGPVRGDLIKCTTTAGDGTYLLSDIPAGEVIVVADGSNINFGTAEAVVTVTSGNTATVDLALDAAPGTIIATVTDTDGIPIANATVEVFADDTRVAQAVTDQNGQASIELQPGDYGVEATAPGFERSARTGVTLLAAQTETVTIALEAEPPGSITGLIARGLSGEPVGGMTVELLVNDQVIASTTTDAQITEPAQGASYNYRFDNVPTGQITVRPDPVGLSVTPEERVVTVVTGQTTDGVNFTVSAIRTFPANLQLMSLPYDYPTDDPADLLGADPSTLKLAAWEPEQGRYRLYPSTPADRFRLGKGYWLRPSEALELTREGIEASDIHEVALQAGTTGWNLFGDFFTEPLDFFALAVRDGGGQIYTMQQALSEGLVRSPLYAYVLGGYQTSAVVEPYVGYWINVGADVTIIGDRQSDTLASGEEGSAPVVTNPDDGWLMPLVVSAAGMQDTCTYLGCAPNATAGFDAGLDMLKPPPPGMGSGVYAAVQNADGAYGVDVRAQDDSTAWTIAASGPEGERVAVRWPDLSALPNDVRPVLVDNETGQQTYMRTAQSYEFVARGVPRSLTVRLADSDSIVTVSQPAARAVGGGAEISYTLSADARVTVSILNIAGRVIDVVTTDAQQTAGVQRVAWDGMTARGTRAPGGTYIVMVRAIAPDGQQTQAIGTVQVTR